MNASLLIGRSAVMTMGSRHRLLCANKIEPAVVITLRERCAFCHGDQLTDMMTFRMHVFSAISNQLDNWTRSLTW